MLRPRVSVARRQWQILRAKHCGWRADVRIEQPKGVCNEMYYVTHLSQRDAPGQPGTGDPFAQDLERREFIRETAVRLFILMRARCAEPTSVRLQAARCWLDAATMWDERPEDA